ncbi:MAG TPA: DHH family phosphoesterase [Methylophaga aminisulfidivorans]|uniref:DHHA1 domain-containing protein n=1 Tax=Methylophaga TaxID=40222 RepID=UPI00177A6968|nr:MULTISPECIES: DHH family phosphoesterase [Methylophaga]HIC46423.1 DHH family phosphoesterase [Methylophaga sp.]HIM39289.1 DHH family phosphoesterase [Methylophaga aminisulfidivorans]
MTNFDVFNGDADGICALVQLRLANPIRSELITGVKRDIKLLSRVDAEKASQVTVLDISMQKNHDALLNLLLNDVDVFYADHHNPGDQISHPRLQALIDMHPNKCTALIINEYLNNAYELWAITAAFGDNLASVAEDYAKKIHLDESNIIKLKTLGQHINYNGYGASIDDLFFAPDELYRCCVNYRSPLDFIDDNTEIIETLDLGYNSDLARAKQQKLSYENETVGVIALPDDKWARRISGTYSNYLSNQYPSRAHLILTEIPESSAYVVSIRAPKIRQEGADYIAGQFDTGGGRKAAAGINFMKEDELPRLISVLESYYKSEAN